MRLERCVMLCSVLIKSLPCPHFRMDCFSTDVFKQCMQSLLLDEDANDILEMVGIIGKRRRR